MNRKRCLTPFFGLLVGTVAASAVAELVDANRCLSGEQREELTRRVVESVAVMALEAKGARSAMRLEAQSVHDNAVRALGECEAQRAREMCEGARSAAKAAANALTAARAEDRAKFGREMAARAAERQREIRKEYPACE
jgi:hypothetical protein